MEFRQILKDLRKLKGLSQVELAEGLHVSKSLIGAYETGDRKPSYEALENIADYFNVDIGKQVQPTISTPKPLK